MRKAPFQARALFPAQPRPAASRPNSAVSHHQRRECQKQNARARVAPKLARAESDPRMPYVGLIEEGTCSDCLPTLTPSSHIVSSGPRPRSLRAQRNGQMMHKVETSSRPSHAFTEYGRSCTRKCSHTSCVGGTLNARSTCCA